MMGIFAYLSECIPVALRVDEGTVTHNGQQQ